MADEKEMTSDDLAFDPSDTLAGTGPTQRNTPNDPPQTKNSGDEVLDPDAQTPNEEHLMGNGHNDQEQRDKQRETDNRDKVL